VIKRKERSLLSTFFGRTRSFSYVPVRDQNLVIWGRNFQVCFISFWKGFKRKSQVAK